MNELVINGCEIGTDSDGRYSLNDLFKASGEKSKNKPALFMQNKSFKDFVDILKVDNPTFSPVMKKQGRYGGGTWVCKELVYKYAMWVEPEFELKVIRTFDAMASKMISPVTSMKSLNELARKIEENKQVASICGQELAKYKAIKSANESEWSAKVNELQLTFGFKS